MIHVQWKVNQYNTDENCKKENSTENVKVNDNEIKQKGENNLPYSNSK